MWLPRSRWSMSTVLRLRLLNLHAPFVTSLKFVKSHHASPSFFRKLASKITLWRRIPPKKNAFRVELVRFSVPRGFVEVMVESVREKDWSFGHADTSDWTCNSETLTADTLRDNRRRNCWAVGFALNLISAYRKVKLLRHRILPHRSNILTCSVEIGTL